MASIINAATSGGLITTADTSGILQLQTAGTTAVTVDASQNVTVVGSLTAAGLSGPHNGTVGATTANTGAFTTLSASGVTTFSAGTAALPALTTTGDTNTGIFFPAADTIAFSEGGVESMRIDASGNMGQKVTPSPWATYSVLQQANGSLASVGTQTQVIQNAYFDGSNMRYITSNGASRYGQDVFGGATHYWYNAPSGTAGNVITFTQTMTLKQDGNNTYVNFGCTGLADAAQLYTGFSSTSSYFAIGTKVSGTLAERVRIDSSGNLLVGATGLTQNASYMGFSPANGFADFGHINGSSSGLEYIKFLYNATKIGSITQSGTTAVLYNLTSDQRLKENIQDAESSSSLIDSIQVRKFDWKTDQTHQRYGFIAQELVNVYPEAVHQPIDAEDMMAVDYSKLVPLLIKEVQSLRARVAQLESN